LFCRVRFSQKMFGWVPPAGWNWSSSLEQLYRVDIR
jgi:hypothetical protein